MLFVLKFGGSSLADAEKIQAAARRCSSLSREGHDVVVVVSAQADTTDELIAKAKALTDTPSPREMDAFLSTGEQMSACLMTMTLHTLGHSAVSLTGWQAGLLTQNCHADARVLGLTNDRIQRELKSGNIVVITGFQGIHSQGDITTLGRGGSDTTAVALAAFLQADVCYIYTDVDGVYDRDPRVFPHAVKYPYISYDDMLRLAQSGAQVLHDRCVELARQYNVKIRVLSSFRPGPGTLVAAAPEDSSQN